MRRWLGIAAALYPRSWREEFGEEFNSLLAEMKPSWRVFTDVLRGAIEMRLTNSSSWVKVVAATAAAGAIVALGLSFRVTPHYEATATIRVTPQVDPLRPTTPEVLRQRIIENMARIQTTLLSRTELSTIINDPRTLLYWKEQSSRPLEDVITEMRQHIRIQRRSSAEAGMAPVVVDISFSYADPVKAQEAVRALAVKWVDATGNINRQRDSAYRDLWGDMLEMGFTKTTPPPPPVGEIAEVVGTTSLPQEVEGHYRFVFLTWGIGIGAFVGLLTAFAFRWPRRTRVLGGFAVAGFVAAAAISYWLPNHYVSTATMMLVPPQITEDPLAPLPAVTPAADYLRRVKPEILSFQNLAKIIQDPRLKLYRSELATMPLEEVVRKMTKDVHIEPVKPVINGPTSAFQISFSYSDRFKAQQAVTALIARLEEMQQKRSRASTPQMSQVGRQITYRKEGEVLDVLDNANIPTIPDWPNLMVAWIGFSLGLILGAIRLYRQRPGTPATISASQKQSRDSTDSGHLPPPSNYLLVAQP